MRAPIICLTLLLLVPAAATAQQRQSFIGTFTRDTPGTPTAFVEAIDYANPNDPDGKPYAVQKVVLRLHPGTVVDTTVPAQCKASQEAFSQSGKDACPPESQVGSGQVDLDTGASSPGIPRIIETETTLFNDQDQLILFLESTNTTPPIRSASRSPVADGTFTTEVPPIPGSPPPDSFTAIKRVRLRIDEVTRGSGQSRRGYLTTPTGCPASNRWGNEATFTYRDGVTYAVTSPTPCRAVRDDRSPAITIAGVPRSCAEGSFTVRVRIADESRLRRVSLFVDGRRIRRTARDRFSKRVRPRRRRSDRHHVGVVAVDAAGNKARRSVPFRSC